MLLETNTLLLGLIALVLLCMLFVILLLIRSFSAKRRILQNLHEIYESLSDDMDTLQENQYQQDLQQREELLRSLHQLNESLVNTFSHMSRSQSEQVNAIVRQSYDQAQAFDQRQQGMQRIVDENLRRMEARVATVEESVARSLTQNESRVENLRKTVDENMRLMREENTKKLNEMRATVDEKLNDTLEKRLSSSFSQVSQRLEQVYRSLGEVHSLAAGVGDLKRMLSNVKTRGVWGEINWVPFWNRR